MMGARLTRGYRHPQAQPAENHHLQRDIAAAFRKVQMACGCPSYAGWLHSVGHASGFVASKFSLNVGLEESPKKKARKSRRSAHGP